MWQVRGKFKIRQLNPCGTFEQTTLHFTSELRELVARKAEKITLALVGILKCQTKKAV